MKKVLIVTPTLRSGGGVIRGLQNMLSLLPKGKYDIDVLPLGYSGRDNVELENCTVLKVSFLLTATDGVYGECENYRYKAILWFCKVLLALLHKLKLRDVVVTRLHKLVSCSYKGYDVVVAYQEGAATHFVQHIKTPHRIAWIHCDYAEYYKCHNYKSEEPIYGKYSDIVCVSDYTLKRFQEIYPSLNKCSLYIYNLLDISMITQSSLANFDDVRGGNGAVQLVSIGRLHSVKQFFLIPSIISKIIKRGVTNFTWILLGSGDTTEYQRIIEEVKKYNVSAYFQYLGPKQNPYPYIKNSDILVSTSSSEACPFVVNEARVLGVPVVSNNYPSIIEFIKDGVNGRIGSIDEMPRILAELISNKEILDCLKEGMRADEYKNDLIITNICNLFDGVES